MQTQYPNEYIWHKYMNNYISSFIPLPLPLFTLPFVLSVVASFWAAMALVVRAVRLRGTRLSSTRPATDRQITSSLLHTDTADGAYYFFTYDFLIRKKLNSFLYLWEEWSDLEDSFSSSSSFHCRPSSSEWTLITSLITCGVISTMSSLVCWLLFMFWYMVLWIYKCLSHFKNLNISIEKSSQ